MSGENVSLLNGSESVRAIRVRDDGDLDPLHGVRQLVLLVYKITTIVRLYY